MKHTKSSGGIQGGWVKASEIVNGTKAKLVSETQLQEGEYGTQIIAKIRIEGDSETKNVRINKPTMNSLIDAFGDESKGWINQELTIQTEQMRVGGKKVTALYLLAEGFELGDDENGYLVITRKIDKSKVAKDMGDIPIIEEEVDVKDIPF